MFKTYRSLKANVAQSYNPSFLYISKILSAIRSNNIVLLSPSILIFTLLTLSKYTPSCPPPSPSSGKFVNIIFASGSLKSRFEFSFIQFIKVLTRCIPQYIYIIKQDIRI